MAEGSAHLVSATESAVAYDGQDLEALADIPNYQQWIVDSFLSRVRGRVLEVGAGIGTLARRYVHAADEAVLLEPAGNLIPALLENMSAFTNARPVEALLKDVAGGRHAGVDFSAGSFDAVVLINVLEHIEDDAEMLRMLHMLLRPGGTLVLFVPALAWLYGSLDRLVDHKRRYSSGGLRSVVRGAGFEIETHKYFDVLGIAPWFVAGRVVRQQSFNAGAAGLYDRFAVPVGAFIEGIFQAPIGKNLLSISRKPTPSSCRQLGGAGLAPGSSEPATVEA
jgi:SAM-dependent methyltransferase